MKHHLKLLAYILFLVIAGCGGNGAEKHPAGMHEVKYEITSSLQDVYISYVDENGETITIDQKNAHDNRWVLTFNAMEGTHLSLYARLLGDGTDTVYVTIFLDSVKVAEEYSYSAAAGAYTSYDIPKTE